MFRALWGESIFRQKYQNPKNETWGGRAKVIVSSVCRPKSLNRGNVPKGSKSLCHGWKRLMTREDCDQLEKYIREFKYVPGGRFIYYAGRIARFYNNCYLMRAEEDSREEWADLWKRTSDCLMTGGGVGTDVNVFRGSGEELGRTGGIASGPLPFLYTQNEIGRNVKQGGSRRSALFGSMAWNHRDAWKFLHAKNWHEMKIAGTDFTVADAKKSDFDYHAPLDMMNISLNYDDEWFEREQRGDGSTGDTFWENCKQAMMTGEPGFSFNFGPKTNETLRNACTEVTSEDDSDQCCLGSVNMANVDSLDEYWDVVDLATKFLCCGLIRAELPTEKCYKVRAKNSRISLGVMGVHEWLLQRGYGYEMNTELRSWMACYEECSNKSSSEFCLKNDLAQPKGVRAIAPTGTISILAGTTSGIEPIYAVAYRRRYLGANNAWKYQYVVDSTAESLINETGIDPDKIETSIDLAKDPEKRIKFQADMQAYVDHAISSTINLPAWGTDLNNIDKVDEFANLIKQYAGSLRGLTIYPNGSRGGQPISACSYEEAKKKKDLVFEENSDEQCSSGICGV